MKTKECPFCHEEISEDAILCKYCHNLLTEDDDDDAPMAYDPEPDNDERTRVFSASEAVRNSRESFRGFNNDYDDEDYDDEYDEDYDDEDYDDDDDYDDDSAKRTFITAAVITLGILLIVIIAIVAGYKIFGKDDSSSAPSLSTSMVDSNSKNDQSAKPADTSIDETSSKDDDESSETDNSSVADTSSEDETSSVPDESSSVPEPDSSSQEESSSVDESSEDESSEAPSVPTDAETIIARAGEIISPYNDSGISRYEYRAEDSAGITMEYYYVYMNDGVSYSVAYNPSTNKYIIAGGGNRFEG